MAGFNQFDTLFQRMNDALPEPVKQMQNEVESNMRQLLESQLHKMNLVTREEFDIQQAVLLKTRSKLEELEKQVAALEEKLQQDKA